MNCKCVFIYFLTFFLYTPVVFAKENRVYLAASFPCANADKPIEKRICESSQTSTYDAVLGYLYKKIREALPEGEKAILKSEQKNWIKQERQKAFDEYRSFGKGESDVWDTLDVAYKDRILKFFDTYKAQCEKFLTEGIGRYKTEAEIPPLLKYSFLYYLYSLEKIPEIKKCKDDPQGCYGTHGASHIFCITNEEKLMPLASGKWIALVRNNELWNAGPCDGHCRFYLIDPVSFKITSLLIENNLGFSGKTYDKSSNQKLKTTDFIQAFFIAFNDEELLLGSGGGCDSERKPTGSHTYKLSSDETTMVLQKSWPVIDGER